MNHDFPVDDRIFVLKNGDSLGPFDIEEILERLESGEFLYDDVCLREGAIETERIRQVLDWEENAEIPPETAEEDSAFDESETESTTEQQQPRQSISGRMLYRGHPSILTFPLSLIGLVGGIVGAVWMFPVDLRVSLLGIAVSILSLAYITLMRFTREYFICPKRIELTTGLIAKSSNEVRISDIRAINVSCIGLMGIFGVGTVDFFTTGDDPEVSFSDIWAAKKVKTLVRQLQDELS